MDILKFDLSASDTCWHCSLNCSTPSYIWHGCPHLATFWAKVSQAYNAATDSNICLDPCTTLLSILPWSPQKIKRCLLRHVVSAARTVVARRWKSDIPPTLIEGICEMDRISSFEHMVSWERTISPKTMELWFLCDHYKTTDKQCWRVTMAAWGLPSPPPSPLLPFLTALFSL